MHRIVLRLFLMAGLILPATALISAAPAAAVVQESCSLDYTTKVLPGLGATAAPQKFRVGTSGPAVLFNCTGPGGKTSATVKGTLKSKSPVNANCATLTTNGSTLGGTPIVTWNDGTKSKGNLTVTVDSPAHGKLKGKITNVNITPPAFTGAKIGGASSFMPAHGSWGSCSDANPVTKLGGNGTITLT